MADGSGYPIHDRFDLLRVMRMAVIVMMSVMGVPDPMGVDMSVTMIVDQSGMFRVFHKRFLSRFSFPSIIRDSGTGG